MKTSNVISNAAPAIAILSLLSAAPNAAVAQEPCPGSDEDIGECKVLIEINSTDGDIGFHFLIDADDARAIRLDDPTGAKVFQDRAFGPLAEQGMTETFLESAEPLCWEDPDADEEDLEEVVSLRDFHGIWASGAYRIRVKDGEGEKVFGETELTYNLPAAPQMVDFNGVSITWMAGNDLGHCAPLAHEGEGSAETVAEVLDIIADPATVPVAAWEIVMEPDVEDGAPEGDEVFSVRVSGDTMPLSVDVPVAYLQSLPADTPVKIEVGAIGIDENATFSETDGFCVNEDEGCEDD